MYVVPSLPTTVTCVALVAVTVRVDELPAAIEVGLALMATVGIGDVLIRLPFTHPVNNSGKNSPGAIKRKLLWIDWRMRAFVKMSTFLS